MTTDDIDAIAKVAGDTELLSIKGEVKDSISQIRGAHQAAGMQLTRLILGELHGRLNELGDQPTRYLISAMDKPGWSRSNQLRRKRREYPANQSQSAPVGR